MKAQEQGQQDGEVEVQEQESGPKGLDVFPAYRDTSAGGLFGIVVGCLFWNN